MLLASKAEPDHRDLYGDSALTYAVLTHKTRTVRELLTAGPNLHILGSNGMTALETARENGTEEIARKLQEEAAESQRQSQPLEEGDNAPFASIQTSDSKDTPADL